MQGAATDFCLPTGWLHKTTRTDVSEISYLTFYKNILLILNLVSNEAKLTDTT
jgi:hypothetical protein